MLTGVSLVRRAVSQLDRVVPAVRALSRKMHERRTREDIASSSGAEVDSIVLRGEALKNDEEG